MNKSLQSNIKNLLNNAGKVFGMKLIGTALVFGFQIILTNKLGKNSFGEFIVLTSVINIFLILSVLGIDTSLIRYIPRINEKNNLRKKILKRSFQTVFIVSLFLCLLMYFFKPFVVTAFKIQNQEYYIYIPIILFIMSLAKVLDGFLQGEKKTDVANFFSPLLLTILKFISFFTIIFFTKNYLSAAILTVLISEIILLIIRIIYINSEKKNILTDIQDKFTKKQYFKFLKYSLSLFAIIGLGTLVSNIDKIIVNQYVGTASVAIYKASESYMGLVAIFPSCFIVFWPVMSELYKNNENKMLEDIFNKVVKIVFVLTIPIIVFVLVFSKDLLGFFGQDFKIGSMVLCVLLIGVAFDAIAGPVGALLNMTNFAKYNLIDNIAFAAIDLLLNLFLVPKLGVVGAAIANSTAVIFINTVNIIQNKMFLNIFPYDKNNIIMIILGFVLYFIDTKLYSLINTNLFLKMFVIGSLNYIIYILLCIVIVKPKLDDIKSLLN